MPFFRTPGATERSTSKKCPQKIVLPRKALPRLPKLARSHLGIAWSMPGWIHAASISRAVQS